MRKTLVHIVIGLLILLCLFFFVGATDWSAVVASVRKIGLRFAALLGISFLVYCAGTLGWRCCLPAELPAGFTRLFWIRHFGETLAMLNPTGTLGGEAVKIWLLERRGLALRPALQGSILSRGSMLAAQFFLTAIAGIWFLQAYRPLSGGMSGHGFYLCFLPAVLLPAFAIPGAGPLKARINGLLRRFNLPDRLRTLRREASGLWEELGVFYRDRKGAMFLSFLFFCAYWLLGALELYVILVLLGAPAAPFPVLAAEMGIILFKMAGAFIPGQLGVEEYGSKVMLTMAGVAGGAVWVSVSVLRRARQLFWVGLGLAVYLIWFRGVKGGANAV